MLVIRHTPDLPLLPPLLAVLVLLNASSAATGVLLGNGTISRDTTPPAAACASLRAVPPPGCVPREGLAANARLLPLLIVGELS